MSASFRCCDISTTSLGSHWRSSLTILFKAIWTTKRPFNALHGEGFKLRVRIDMESAPTPRVSIKDNAAGIARDQFPRAFRPAAVPTDKSGLSEFGMGMKSASCWFSPRWDVRTKALGERVERTVRFDIDRIVLDQIEELEIEETPGDADATYRDCSR